MEHPRVDVNEIKQLVKGLHAVQTGSLYKAPETKKLTSKQKNKQGLMLKWHTFKNYGSKLTGKS